MLFGHSSHQIGLDADIWLREMPNRRLTAEEREEIPFISMLKGPLDVKGADRSVDPNKWTDTHARLIRRAASDERVARIFVNPTIKKALCEFETGSDRAWLQKSPSLVGASLSFSCPAFLSIRERGLQEPGPAAARRRLRIASDLLAFR